MRSSGNRVPSSLTPICGVEYHPIFGSIPLKYGQGDMRITLPQRDYDRSINSEIERLLYQSNVILMDAKGLASGANELLIWTPGRGQWSATQCLEHLNITHRRWQPLFERAIHSAREQKVLSDGPYSYGFFSRMFLRMTEPPAKFRLKAPGSFQPPNELTAQKVMAEFEQHHRELEKLIRAANGLDLARIRVTSAFSKYVRYSLGMGFWILLAHDRRHIRQAREVLQQAGGRAEAG